MTLLFRSGHLLWLLLAFFPVIIVGCTGQTNPNLLSSPDPIGQLLVPSQHAFADEDLRQPLAQMGYAVQVGAFRQLENAVRFEATLNNRGVEAFYFRDDSGLFKVHFGNHRDYGSARAQAKQLAAQGLIGNFFIVIPESYSSYRARGSNQDQLRHDLVQTAKRFIGVPYRWGGTDQSSGFDCSGLTMVSYRLNGLELPRVSRSQFQAGRSVSRSQLQQGDLVFFDTTGNRQVSHVGMYIGNGRFIHAPRTGARVRIENLSSPYFTRTYMGGRTYF